MFIANTANDGPGASATIGNMQVDASHSKQSWVGSMVRDQFLEHVERSER